MSGDERARVIAQTLWEFDGYENEPDGAAVGGYIARAAAVAAALPTPAPEGDEIERLIERLIERSSLGTPEAKALRASVADEQAARVVARARELEVEEPPAGEDATLTADERAAVAVQTLCEAHDELRRLWVEDGHHFGHPGCYSSGYERWLLARADQIARTSQVPAQRGAADGATLAAVRALVESWPHGNNGQEYRRAVTQCRAAILALLDGPDAGGGRQE